MTKKKNVYDEITKVAYNLFENRGKVHGYDLEDWVEAERIVMERHAKEIEEEATIIRSTKGKKASGKPKPKTVKTSKKTTDNAPQTKTKKTPSTKKT